MDPIVMTVGAIAALAATLTFAVWRTLARPVGGDRFEDAIARMTGADISEVDTVLTKSGPSQKLTWTSFWYDAVIKTGRTVADPESPGRVMIGVAVLAAFFGLVVFPTGVEGIAVPLLALAGVWLFFSFEQGKRRLVMEKQLPLFLSSLRTQMSAGMTVQAAIVSVADELPAPIGDEIRQVKADINVAVTLEDALGAMAGRMKSRVMFFLISSIGIAVRSGSDLIPQLITIEEIVRQRSRIEGKIRSALALAKPTSYLAIAAPPAVAVYQVTTDPTTLPFFLGPDGFLMLLLALGLYGGGIFAIRTMVKNVEKI